MPEADDDELLTLRNRAYGPSPDIHDDLTALGRLDQLENERKLASSPTETDVPQTLLVELKGQPTPSEVEQPTSPSGSRQSWPVILVETVRRALRSSILIGVGAILVAMSLLAAIILVPRVQVDPLQTGAKQVARLSLDTGFETPEFFAAGTGDVFGFQLFHGLRTVVSKTGFFAVGDNQDTDCLSVYVEADMVAATSDGFSGQALGGCAAGRFPAIVQFRPDALGYPDELKSAFPKPSALQFVYDKTNNEVVIFAQPQ